MIGRRAFSAGLLSLVAMRAEAQARRRIGILMPYAADDQLMQGRVGAFRLALDKLGWTADRTLDVEERWVTDDLGRVRQAAAELASLRLDAILTTGSRVVPLVQQAVGVTPIVFVGVSDPVGQGMVTTLSRPGGNITGFSLLEFDGERSPLMTKLFEIMRDLAPGLKRAAIMFNPQNPAHRFHARTFQEIARQLGVDAVEARIGGLPDVEPAIAAFAAQPNGVMLLPSDLTLLAHRAPIVAAMARHRVPAIYSDRSFVESGGLCSYSADRTDMFARSADYVNRILRGERAADLPVQQPTRYELVLNAATARELGINLPLATLARADEVIE
jgi:putative tryptophan/tyrosine transport system substrate-binding protein